MFADLRLPFTLPAMTQPRLKAITKELRIPIMILNDVCELESHSSGWGGCLQIMVFVEWVNRIHSIVYILLLPWQRMPSYSGGVQMITESWGAETEYIQTRD